MTDDLKAAADRVRRMLSGSGEPVVVIYGTDAWEPLFRSDMRVLTLGFLDAHPAGSETVEFVGRPGDEGEAFCWLVSAEQFEAATGGPPEDYRRHRRTGLFRLYPDDLPLHSRSGTAVRVRVTVSPADPR